MSDQKDLITFDQSLPIISKSLDTLIFTNLSTNLSNLYRTYVDFVRREYDDLQPVSFVTFVSWFMERPYFFKFNNDSKLVGVFRDLSENPDYKALEKFVNFYIVWQLDISNNKKESLGICFPVDKSLNESQKIIAFQSQFNLQTDFEFYDVDAENNLMSNRISSPFVSSKDLDTLQKILGAGWQLCGTIDDLNSEFWKIIQKHIQTRQKI